MTGLALPMLDGLESIRTFTADTGALSKAAQALPVPPALTEKTATTDDLIAMLKASQALKAAVPTSSATLLDGTLAQTPPPKSWLDQAKGTVEGLTT